MGTRRKKSCPTHTTHHNITHETFTSLCGLDDHASLPLAEKRSAQSRRQDSIGVVRAWVMTGRRGGWRGYWINRSRSFADHTDEGKGKCCRNSEDGSSGVNASSYKLYCVITNTCTVIEQVNLVSSLFCPLCAFVFIPVDKYCKITVWTAPKRITTQLFNNRPLGNHFQSQGSVGLYSHF